MKIFLLRKNQNKFPKINMNYYEVSNFKIK